MQSRPCKLSRARLTSVGFQSSYGQLWHIRRKVVSSHVTVPANQAFRLLLLSTMIYKLTWRSYYNLQSDLLQLNSHIPHPSFPLITYEFSTFLEIVISILRSFLHEAKDNIQTSHHNDVTMSCSIVYSTVCSGADQRKHQSSAWLAFLRVIHRWPVNSPHKGPVTRKVFPFDDVIMSGSNDKTQK